MQLWSEHAESNCNSLAETQKGSWNPQDPGRWTSYEESIFERIIEASPVAEGSNPAKPCCESQGLLATCLTLRMLPAIRYTDSSGAECLTRLDVDSVRNFAGFF